MTKIGFLAIACALAATAAGFAARPRETVPPDHTAAQAAIAPGPSAPLAATEPWPAAQVPPVAELNSDSDTTGLLLPAPTLDEFLEIASAASAEPLGDADRGRLAALIRSDPELREQFGE